MKNKGGKILTILFAFALGVNAQIYKTSTGTVSFHSGASENIDATNSAAAAALSAATGAVEFSVAINSFQFKKALMQKHFQENYMESSKYSKATFKGKITDNTKVNYTKDGTYAVSIKGNLTIHGVTKEVTIPGNVVVKGNKITLQASGSDFKVKPKDYDIKIPANNAAQIAEEIEITVNCELTKK